MPEFESLPESPSPEVQFAGRVALVTGGGSGIGRAVALRLAGAGATVIVSDFELDAAKRVANQIGGAGERALALRIDVSDPASVKAGITTCRQNFGGLHMAVNNAGIDLPRKATGEYALENWKRVIDVNLSGVFYCLRYEILAMLESGGGAIVNLASVMGQRGLAGQPAYTAAKHGVIGLTKSAALDYADKGIRINAVAPGFIETPLLSHLSATARQEAVARHPIGRLGQADEIAETILFLLSDRSSFTTGACYEVDGGYLAG